MPDPKLYIEVLNDGSQDLYIRDAEAQEEIESIKNTIKNGASYIGKFVSAVVGGETVSELNQGDVVTSITTTKGTFVTGAPASGQTKLNEGDYVEVQGTNDNPSMEYMWNGDCMDEFGSTSLLKSLAFKDSAQGTYTPAGQNAPSAVTFTGGTDGDFVTGYNNDAVAPSFQEGAFSQGSLPSKAADTFDAGSLPSKAADTFNAGSLPTMTYDENSRKLTFGAGTLPSYSEGAFDAGSLPSYQEGAFDAGSLPSKAADTFNAGSAATLATGKAITNIGTGEAAAQTFTGTQATITVQ